MKKVTNKVLTKTKPKQFEVAVMALYLLGGATRSTDTEDVAVKCHELAPTLFSWQKYKDQINLELVRVSLSDAKKTKNGELVSGSGREGWRLSPKGLDWIIEGARAHLIDGQGEIKRGQSKAGSIDSVRRQRERNRLLASNAWQKWSESGVVGHSEAREFFRMNNYTTEKMLEIKVARLRAMFEDDESVSRFLEDAAREIKDGR